MTEADGFKARRDGLRALARMKMVRESEPGGHARVEALMLSTDAGILLHGWKNGRLTIDQDTFSGMLSAVMAFMRDSLDEKGPQSEDAIRTESIALGGRTLMSVRRGKLVATAVVSGGASGWLRDELGSLLLDAGSGCGAGPRDPDSTAVEQAKGKFNRALARMLVEAPRAPVA